MGLNGLVPELVCKPIQHYGEEACGCRQSPDLMTTIPKDSGDEIDNVTKPISSVTKPVDPVPRETSTPGDTVVKVTTTSQETDHGDTNDERSNEVEHPLGPDDKVQKESAEKTSNGEEKDKGKDQKTFKTKSRERGENSKKAPKNDSRERREGTEKTPPEERGNKNVMGEKDTDIKIETRSHSRQRCNGRGKSTHEGKDAKNAKTESLRHG